MKKIITLLFVICTFTAYGQFIEKEDDDKLSVVKIVNDKMDDFTGTRVLETNMLENTGKRIVFKKTDYIDNSNELLVSMSYYKTSDTTEFYIINFLFSDDIGCLSEYDGKVMIMLDNDEILTFKQQSKTDCGSSTKNVRYYIFSEDDLQKPIYQEIMKENFNKLSDIFIRKIRIYGTEHYIDFEIKPEKKNIISLHCNVINDRINNK